MAPRSQSQPALGLDPQNIPPSLRLLNGGLDATPQAKDGVIQIEHPDGSVTIKFGDVASKEQTETVNSAHDENLALKMDDGLLAEIATQLLDGIERDEQSRKDWIDTRSLGINLLGLKLERPRTDAGISSAPLEGMSVVRHPALLEATVTFQATARAELLPASGPVKVRNDSTIPPQQIQQQTNAMNELRESLSRSDDLANALEKDFNHWLTAIATEYYPDTDRMLFYVGFGGDGFKKIYNCPLRQRPVAESIDAEDLIISNVATDLYNAGRVTHRIKMRKSTLKRMQIMGVYRDVDLSPPVETPKTSLDQVKEAISGVTSAFKLPEDRDYEIFETYCELDIDDYAPKKFKGKGMPLPYRVTLEKHSRQVLDVRRNWKEDDKECLAKRFFVQYPFIRGIGFYGLGYIHLLGNTTMALTAAWREMLDNGMFSNFPGYLYAEGAGRQLTNQMRVAPGTGQPVKTGAQKSIRDVVMPLPYKETGPSFTAFVTHMEEVARRLASTGNINVGEGKQDAPVGTTLALIEQATKVIDSAHKRLHAAQAEEFKLLKERFREDPEAFWRHNKKPTVQWKKDQFIEALNNCDLVPTADPNNPTSLHRIAKGMAIKELQKLSPDLYDPIAVDMRVMRIGDIDPEGLFRATPAPKPPDPRMVAIQQKAAAADRQSQTQLTETQIKAATEAAKIQSAAEDRASKERIANLESQQAMLKLQQDQVIHQGDQERDTARLMHELNMEQASKSQELQHNALETQQQLHHETIQSYAEMAHERALAEHEESVAQMQHAAQLRRDTEKHQREAEQAQQKHEQAMRHADALNEAKVAAARAMAKAKPKPKPAKKKE